MTPNAAPLDRAAIAREATLQLVNEFTDGTLPDVFRLTPAQRARMLGYIDGEYPAPSPTPPPIPLGAVVEVEGESGLESWVWNGAEWMSGGERLHVAAVRWRALMLTALYHARRELVDAERALREEACPEANSEDGTRFVCYDENADPIIEADTIADAIRDMARCWARTEEARIRMRDERDAARRELAELQVVARGMVESARGEAVDLGSFTSPAPASAPRRWWLVVDRDGYPVYAYSSERLAVEQAQEDNENVPRPAFTPYSVVPVVEARVTRETVERVEGIVRKARGTNRTSEHWAYEIVRALGLTVEE